MAALFFLSRLFLGKARACEGAAQRAGSHALPLAFFHLSQTLLKASIYRSRPIRWCNSAGQVRRNVVRTVSQRLGPPVLMHHHG